jgi:UDP-GlcNAc3NAcA epimerase
MTAAKLSIPVAHVEAGLRSFNRKMPEEINRLITDRLSTILFAPTETAVKNLENEGIGSKVRSSGNHFPLVLNTGDVMLDATLYYKQYSAQHSTITSRLDLKDRDFILCTIHRAENTDDPDRLKNIFDALNQISRSICVVLPLHPRTQKILNEQGLKAKGQGPIIVPPVGYFDTIELLKKCQMVITDSGGLQKEAFFFQKTCLTLRDETEWVELVELGLNRVVGSHVDEIIKAFHSMRQEELNFNVSPYGEGKAAQQVVQGLLSWSV